MIRAAEKFTGVALWINRDFGAFMRTAIVQYMYFTVAVANLDHRLITYLCGDVVTLIGSLAVVTNEDPGIGKKVLHFGTIDRLTGVHITVHLMALYHCFDFGSVDNVFSLQVQATGSGRGVLIKRG